MNKLSELTPGKDISTLVRVLEDPEKISLRDKKIPERNFVLQDKVYTLSHSTEMVKAKVGDGTDIVNLVAWGRETGRWNLNKGDVVKISGGVCPKTHGDTRHPPSITIASNTVMEKQEINFPSIQECMGRRFLGQVSDYSYSVVNGFIVQVYDTVSYFCNKCKKFTDEMCDCGSFPEPLYKIQGVFSDGTRSMNFTTLSEDVAESLSKITKSDAKRMDVKELMNKPHTLLVYSRGKKLYIEDVIG
jgi:hypothetical protein